MSIKIYGEYDENFRLLSMICHEELIAQTPIEPRNASRLDGFK